MPVTERLQLDSLVSLVHDFLNGNVTPNGDYENDYETPNGDYENDYETPNDAYWNPYYSLMVRT